MRSSLVLLALTWGALLCGAQMTLQSIPADIFSSTNPRCLDGSAAKFYYEPAPLGSTTTQWVIFFEGGGFCATFSDCVDRSTISLGSSTQLDSTLTVRGVLDSDATFNPIFSQFHRVYVPYCDGFFMSGDQPDQVFEEVDGQQKGLWFRGHGILNGILDTLLREYGLGNATQVLLSGESAGAMTVYFNGEYIKSRLPQNAVVKASPISGFFLTRTQLDGQNELRDGVIAADPLHLASPLKNNSCNNFVADPRECLLPNETYAHYSLPIFVINSALDAFSLGFHTAGQDFGECANPDNEFQTCNANQVATYNRWRDNFVEDISRSQTSTAPGNGMFIHTCFEHSEARDREGFTSWSLNSTRLVVALGNWFTAPVSSPASQHTYKPCSLTTQQPVQCNPSCLLTTATTSPPTASTTTTTPTSTPSASPTATPTTPISPTATPTTPISPTTSPIEPADGPTTSSPTSSLGASDLSGSSSSEGSSNSESTGLVAGIAVAGAFAVVTVVALVVYCVRKPKPAPIPSVEQV
uniref:Pectin acetylesterase n=1 Tax=Lotharella globosa TaxID=91324 RepID=A0A7S3YDJ4_9EUKA|mmetsp:Transcript_3598/g.7282  ORF Transcript_3598/g.7282 Transcript_3598/m.7282 type:complete len:525 (-) Transcript_3598:92-1666(-)